jgi:site-specific DNA recombinase
MKTAIIYRRVSSKGQEDEGKSLEDQDAELIDYCRAMRWEVLGNFQDVESGRREKTSKRKGLEKAIALACDQKATLVVYDLDRLARSSSVGLQIVERLQDCGASLVVKSLGLDTTTPAGELMLTVMFAFAQWGSRNIGEGVKRADRQSKRKFGRRTQGKQPFGWKFDHESGQPVKCPIEQEILQKIKRAKRGKTYRAAADELNAHGVPTRTKLRKGTDTLWSAKTVHQLLSKA